MVFIVPLIFTYIAFHSIEFVIALIVIRIAIMYIPNPWAKKKPSDLKPEPTKITEMVIANNNPLTPYKEEAISEWRWLMKTLHIYDHEKEDKYLKEYRRLRGWE